MKNFGVGMNEQLKNKSYNNIESDESSNYTIFETSTVRYFGTQQLSYISEDFLKRAYKQKYLFKKFFKVIEGMSESDAKSLYLIRSFLVNDSWEMRQNNSNSYAELLAKHLRSCREPLETFNAIIYYKLNYCVEDSYFKWFEKDLRSALYVAYLARSQLRMSVFKGKKDLINNLVEILKYNIHVFNGSYQNYLPECNIKKDINGEEKLAHIEFVKYIYLKNKTCENDIKWIDPSNRKQIEWMYDYLNKTPNGIILENIFFPESINEKYQQILATLDLLSNVYDEKLGPENNKGWSCRCYIISSLKNAWKSQLNYNKNKYPIEERYVKILKRNYEILDKIIDEGDLTEIQVINEYISNYHKFSSLSKSEIVDEDCFIKLSPSSYDKLVKISRNYNVNIAKMIENLIDQEHEVNPD